MFEIMVIVPISHTMNEFLACFEVRWFSTSMQLVLQSMLDIEFQIFGNVIPMSNVSNPRHGYRNHELISKTGQLRLQKSNDVSVGAIAFL